jgi:hypothetical protein
MLETLVDKVAAPLGSRLGTALGSWLVGSGIASAEAEKIAAGVAALALVIADLFIDNLRVKRAIRVRTQK